jgi:beta-phosphoglucomutase-like phosphatase (HAD superfamily)
VTKKKDELDNYLDIARISELVDMTTSSEDVTESKPAPDIFQVALKKLGIKGNVAVALGDTPYDAEAAGKAGITAKIGSCAADFWKPISASPAASPFIRSRLLCCFVLTRRHSNT